MTYGAMAKMTGSTRARRLSSPTTRARRITGFSALFRVAWKWAGRALVVLVALCLALIVLYRFFNPPTDPYMFSERRRLGVIDRQWTPMQDIAPVMARSAVAAEDANFCNHWGFDMGAIREAIDEGANRGASTITQQMVRNVYLWQGRNWLRKALEAAMTPAVEMIWSKRRILEIYLNIAEFDEGVFGVNAAAFHYFQTTPDKLTAHQAALLAAILPDPRGRSASNPSAFVSHRARSIMDGAATIRKDGRAGCFE